MTESKQQAHKELLEAAVNLFLHHRIVKMQGVSDTLDERLRALRAAIAKVEKVS